MGAMAKSQVIQEKIVDLFAQLAEASRAEAMDDLMARLRGSASASDTAGAARPTRGRPPQKNGRKPDIEKLTQKIGGYIRENPGQTSEQLAEALAIDSKSIKFPLRKLRQAKAVTTKGTRRGMKYYAKP